MKKAIPPPMTNKELIYEMAKVIIMVVKINYKESRTLRKYTLVTSSPGDNYDKLFTLGIEHCIACEFTDPKTGKKHDRYSVFLNLKEVDFNKVKLSESGAHISHVTPTYNNCKDLDEREIVASIVKCLKDSKNIEKDLPAFLAGLQEGLIDV